MGEFGILGNDEDGKLTVIDPNSPDSQSASKKSGLISEYKSQKTKKPKKRYDGIVPDLSVYHELTSPSTPAAEVPKISEEVFNSIREAFVHTQSEGLTYEQVMDNAAAEVAAKKAEATAANELSAAIKGASSPKPLLSADEITKIQKEQDGFLRRELMPAVQPAVQPEVVEAAEVAAKKSPKINVFKPAGIAGGALAVGGVFASIVDGSLTGADVRGAVSGRIDRLTSDPTGTLSPITLSKEAFEIVNGMAVGVVDAVSNPSAVYQSVAGSLKEISSNGAENVKNFGRDLVNIDKNVEVALGEQPKNAKNNTIVNKIESPIRAGDLELFPVESFIIDKDIAKVGQQAIEKPLKLEPKAVEKPEEVVQQATKSDAKVVNQEKHPHKPVVHKPAVHKPAAHQHQAVTSGDAFTRKIEEFLKNQHLPANVDGVLTKQELVSLQKIAIDNLFEKPVAGKIVVDKHGAITHMDGHALSALKGAGLPVVVKGFLEKEEGSFSIPNKPRSNIKSPH